MKKTIIILACVSSIWVTSAIGGITGLSIYASEAGCIKAINKDAKRETTFSDFVLIAEEEILNKNLEDCEKTVYRKIIKKRHSAQISHTLTCKNKKLVAIYSNNCKKDNINFWQLEQADIIIKIDS